MSKIFFVSDTHWSHHNIIKYCNRPFLSEGEQQVRDKGLSGNASWTDYDAWVKLRLSPETIRRHDDTIIEKWNAVVSPNDTIYHLGDFGFGSPEQLEKIASQLNGQKFLILGNHDKKGNGLRKEAKAIEKYFGWIKDYYEVKIPDNGVPRGKRKVVLFHYPMVSWNNMRHQSYALHAHCHGSLRPWTAEHMPNARTMDVGVDCHDFSPVSYEQIREYMSTKKGDEVDHHVEG